MPLQSKTLVNCREGYKKAIIKVIILGFTISINMLDWPSIYDYLQMTGNHLP